MLDPIATALVVLIACSGFAVAIQTLAQRDPTPAGQAYRYWSHGLVMGPAGWVLIELAWSGTLAWLWGLGLTLVVAGSVEILRAVLAFRGRRVASWVLSSPILLAALATAVLSVFTPHASLGLVVISLICAGLAVLAAREALGETAAAQSPHGITVAVALGVAVCALLMQGLAAALTSPLPWLAMMQTETGRSILVALVTLAPAAATLGFVLMGSDRLINHARRVAAIDSLTGLPNRRAFMDASTKAIAHAARHGEALALLIVDVDHFKSVNDTYGHQVGDRAMVAIGAALAGELRQEDLVGRIGGEEFGVVLPQLSDSTALHVAERLRVAVRKVRVLANGQRIPLTVSVGVTQMQDASDDLSRLMRQADTAMYTAKDKGRDRVERYSGLGPTPAATPHLAVVGGTAS